MVLYSLIDKNLITYLPVKTTFLIPVFTKNMLNQILPVILNYTNILAIHYSVFNM